MTDEQAQQVADLGREAYEVAMLSFDIGNPNRAERPSEVYRAAVREQCHALGVAERDFYVHYPEAGAAFLPEVVTGWHEGPIKRGTPMVAPVSGEGHLQWLAADAVDRYERALADGLDPETAHRQAAGDTVVANDALERYARYRSEGQSAEVASGYATAEAAAAGMAGLEREGSVLPPESEWERPAPVPRPDLERAGATLAEIGQEAIDYVTELIDAGMNDEDALAAVASQPVARLAVEKFYELTDGGASEPEAREHVISKLRTPIETAAADAAAAAQAGTADARTEGAEWADDPCEDAHAAADDVDVVVIDPAEVMLAEDALRNYDTADDAIARFAQLTAEGFSDTDAATRAVEASNDGTGLAAAAVEEYRRQCADGVDHDTARSAVTVGTADRFTPRVGPEVAQQIADALAEPPTANAQDTAGAAAEPRAFVLGDVVRDRRTGEVWTVTGNAAGWDPAEYEPVHDAPGPEVPEREPEPDSWIARNLSGGRVVAPAEPTRVSATPARTVEEEEAAWQAELGQYRTEQAAMGQRAVAAYEELVADGMDGNAAQAAAAEAVNPERPSAASAAIYWHRDREMFGEARRSGVSDFAAAAGAVLAAFDAEPAAGSAASEAVGDRPVAEATDRAADGRSTRDVIGQIDEVLAEEDSEPPPALGDAVTECGQAVDAAEAAVVSAEVDEDTERGERCARWNAEDEAAENDNDARELG